MSDVATESEIIELRLSGAMSVDESFDRLYAMYSSQIYRWFAVRLQSHVAEDLSHDVWTIFLNRWRTWEAQQELRLTAATPVLAFLFRTANFVLKAHSRQKKETVSLDDVDLARRDRTEQLAEFSRLLDRAKVVCSDGEFNVITAKLVGLSAEEIAEQEGCTPAVVDHRFRTGLKKLSEVIGGKKPSRRSRGHGV